MKTDLELLFENTSTLMMSTSKTMDWRDKYAKRTILEKIYIVEKMSKLSKIGSSGKRFRTDFLEFSSTTIKILFLFLFYFFMFFSKLRLYKNKQVII